MTNGAMLQPSARAKIQALLLFHLNADWPSADIALSFSGHGREKNGACLKVAPLGAADPHDYRHRRTLPRHRPLAVEREFRGTPSLEFRNPAERGT
jgi:hypothetical protein